MSARPGRADRAGRRAEIRDRLLVAAERMLHEGEPYAAISVERISREAELTRTTFYVYFEDKADLLHSWLEKIDTEVGEVADAWGELAADLGPADLRRTLGRILTAYRPHVDLMAALYDAALFDRALDMGLQELVRRMADALCRHIRRGQREGWIDPGLQPAETASWLAWMLQRGQRRLRSVDDAEFQRETGAYTEIFWNVLYAPPRRRA